MRTYMLSEIDQPTQGPARCLLVYVPENIGFAVPYAANLRKRLTILRSQIGRPRNALAKSLKLFCSRDPARRDPNNWRVYELTPNDLAEEKLLPVVPLLNAPVGKPPNEEGPRGPSPLTALHCYHGDSHRTVFPALQDTVDRWPVNPSPTFTATAARTPEHAKHRYFSQLLAEAMAHDRNVHPSPAAISGLYLWWAHAHGLIHLAAPPPPAGSLPQTMFDIFEPLDPPGWPNYSYKGKPELRQRGYRRVALP